MRYLAICAFLLALVVPAATTAQQGTDAASLLALHRAYVGWQFGDGTFTSLRETGSIVNTKPEPGHTPNSPTPVLTVIRGAAYRTTQIDPESGRRDDAGFTGRVFWESNQNGFTHPIIGDPQKFEVSYQLLVMEGTAGLTGMLESPVTIDGTSYPVVRVSPSAGFPLDLAVNPKTGAYVQAVIDPGGAYEEKLDIVSYAEALPGKRIRAVSRVHDSHYTTTYTSFEPNVTITDDQLHPPPQTAAWSFADPNPFSITTHGDQILVPATINGVAGTFLFDTGASDILLTADFAARAHVRRAESAMVGGIGGTTSAEADILDSIVVGGNTLWNVYALSAGLGNDYRGLLGGGANGQRVDGILGYDLMGRAVVKVNMGASTMTILDPATADFSQEHGILLNLDLNGGQPAVPMKLDGTIDVNTTLDTGDALGIGYSRELVRKYHLSLLRFPAMIGGVGGGEFTSCGAFGTLQIGPVTLDAQDEMACETSALSGNDLLVGYDFLKHFNMIFDYPRGQLILEPLPQ
ncbi:MAG TPA: retropepsin-like aspartic protease [Candidatus Tyrphobacter sp.]